MLDRKAASLQAAVCHEAGVEDEKERWQDEIRESYGGEEKQQLSWIAHHHIHGGAPHGFDNLNQLKNAKL
jgi:hypothetical protein